MKDDISTRQTSPTTPEPMEAPITVESDISMPTIGLCANYADTPETRFLLTPEVCGLLISAGYLISMESGAGATISYSDANYSEFGVKITNRSEVLKSDYVLSYAPLRSDDIDNLKEGSTVMCMFDTPLFNKNIIEQLLKRKICVLSLDHVESHNAVPVFANIVDEVDGRTSIWYAQEAFSFLGGGKGVLLGGVAGINPCEVLIFGQGTRVLAAARTAMAFGAIVTLMDNDISALQLAQLEAGKGLITCAIHPRALANKIKSADAILIDSCTRPFEFPDALKAIVKPDAFVLDFNTSSPSLSTPRTVTQALATCLNNLFDEITLKGGIENTIATTPGVRVGIITYGGHVTDKLVSSVSGIPYIDVEMLLTNAN